MRMRTKSAAVLFTALLFVIGVSMTSFANQGWTEEDGGWSYYNRDGARASNSWKKSGDAWYWLDSDGVMAADRLIEYGENYYYVDESGVMMANQWVQVANNDEQDGDAPSHWWYYFQNNGKAFKADSNGRTALRSINGKKYAFDSEGRMLSGWVDDDSTRQTGDDAWKLCDYYMGGEDDGAVSLGWMQIPVIDEESNWDKSGEESENQDYWFYFQSNGRKFKKISGGGGNDEPIRTKNINGHSYGFDVNGRMVSGWTEMKAVMNEARVASASTYGYNYFNSRDDGARMSKGWFKAVPDPDTNQNGYDAEESYWYYAYSEGRLCASEFKNINGRRYAFDNSGRMMTGLQAIYIDTTAKGNPVMFSRKLDEEDVLAAATELTNASSYEMTAVNAAGEEYSGLSIAEAAAMSEIKNSGIDYGVYYFGNDDEGAARTGAQNIDIDGERYAFYFVQSGDKKGKGVNGKKDNYMYQNGKKVKADKDNKYEAYYISLDGVNAVTGLADPSIISGHCYYVAPDELSNYSANHVGNDGTRHANSLFLVDASGKLVNGDKAVKDGNEMYYKVVNGKVVQYYDKDNTGHAVDIN